MVQTGSPQTRTRLATRAPAVPARRPDAVQGELLRILRTAARDPRTEVSVKAIEEIGKSLRSYQDTQDAAVQTTGPAATNSSRNARLRWAGQAVRAVVHPVVSAAIYSPFVIYGVWWLINLVQPLHPLPPFGPPAGPP